MIVNIPAGQVNSLNPRKNYATAARENATPAHRTVKVLKTGLFNSRSTNSSEGLSRFYLCQL